MGPLTVAFFVGLLLGSVPAAWLLVRLATRKNLSESGSSNVGALNALRVSRSKLLGAAVLGLDALKGAAAVWFAMGLAGRTGYDLLSLQGAATIGAVAGHNYNPWLSLAARKLVGGKGLAAAAGALLVYLPWLVAVWFGLLLLSYGLFRLWRGVRDEAPATAVAMLGTIPAAAFIYGPCAAIIAACLALLVLPKLVREVRALLFSGPPTEWETS